jgi:hypothetical protein
VPPCSSGTSIVLGGRPSTASISTVLPCIGPFSRSARTAAAYGDSSGFTDGQPLPHWPPRTAKARRDSIVELIRNSQSPRRSRRNDCFVSAMPPRRVRRTLRPRRAAPSGARQTWRRPPGAHALSAAKSGAKRADAARRRRFDQTQDGHAQARLKRLQADPSLVPCVGGQIRLATVRAGRESNRQPHAGQRVLGGMNMRAKAFPYPPGTALGPVWDQPEDRAGRPKNRKARRSGLSLR